jgi:cytidylate kinase
MKILGIAGTDGSGKDSLAEFIREKYGWSFISVTDSLRNEAKKRGIKLGRETLREISAEWRRNHGLGVLVDRAVDEYNKSKRENSAGLIVSSLRNPGEADRVHALGGIVVWVDADSKTRYNRIHTRNRGTEDHVTFDQFVAEEKAQSEYSGDSATLNLNSVKSRADIFIDNSGDDLELFKTEVENVLSKYI